MRFTFIDSDTGMFKSVMDPALTKPNLESVKLPVELTQPPAEAAPVTPTEPAPPDPAVPRQYLQTD